MVEVTGQLQAPVAVLTGKDPPVNRRIGGWVGPTTCMDVSEKKITCCPSRESNPVSFRVKVLKKLVFAFIFGPG